MSKEYPCVYYDNEKCRKDPPEEGYVDWCVMGPCPYETPSNGDRIRAMSDEDLGCFLWQHICFGIERCPDHGECHRCVLEWLKQPAKEDV